MGQAGGDEGSKRESGAHEGLLRPTIRRLDAMLGFGTLPRADRSRSDERRTGYRPTPSRRRAMAAFSRPAAERALRREPHVLSRRYR
jgi:hypothetical protein